MTQTHVSTPSPSPTSVPAPAPTSSAATPPVEPVWIGIDVAKAELVIAERPSGRIWRSGTDPEALEQLTRDLIQCAPQRIIVEPSGGYERALVSALVAAGLPVVPVNPRRAAQFGRSGGVGAKTDPLDAAMLAQYGEAHKPPVRALPDAATQELQAWIDRRRQLIETLRAERLRLELAHPRVRPQIERHVRWLEEELEAAEQAIAEQITASEAWAQQAQLLQSIPGIGKHTAAMLLADLPELGQIEGKGIAALVGVAPLNRDSGTRRGHRSIFGGRAPVRTGLWMPTRTAIIHNPVIRAFYERLIAAGKAKKVAIIACMRKLITICHAILVSQKPWQAPETASAT